MFDDGNLLIGSVTPEDANRKYACHLTSALPNHQAKPTNWARLSLLTGENESADSSSFQANNQIHTNELFNFQQIKQLLRSIDHNPNGLLQPNRQVYVLPKRPAKASNGAKNSANDLNEPSANPNSSMRLYCTTNAFAAGPVKWYRQVSHSNLEPILALSDDPENHYQLEFDSSVLAINSPKLSDSGLFVALISNRQRPDQIDVKCTIELVVREPLAVEVSLSPQSSAKQRDLFDPADTLGQHGASADAHGSINAAHNSINCTVHGSPVNQIQFYHNGLLLDTVLLSPSSFKSPSDEPPIKSYTLSLNPSHSAGNSMDLNGVYQCFAINDYEIETGSYTLMQTRKCSTRPSNGCGGINAINTINTINSQAGH